MISGTVKNLSELSLKILKTLGDLEDGDPEGNQRCSKGWQWRKFKVAHEASPPESVQKRVKSSSIQDN